MKTKIIIAVNTLNIIFFWLASQMSSPIDVVRATIIAFGLAFSVVFLNLFAIYFKLNEIHATLTEKAIKQTTEVGEYPAEDQGTL